MNLRLETLNLNSAVGQFEKPRNTRITRKIIRFLERRFREFRVFRGESWRFGILQAFTIWVNPFSVVTCVRVKALSLRILRLCGKTQTRLARLPGLTRLPGPPTSRQGLILHSHLAGYFGIMPMK